MQQYQSQDAKPVLSKAEGSNTRRATVYYLTLAGIATVVLLLTRYRTPC